MKREIYIANGNYFNSFEEVVEYAEKLGVRVTNTETIHKKKRTVYLITLNK